MKTWVATFLERLEAGDNISTAARVAGTSRRNVYAWAARSAENARRMHTAQAAALMDLPARVRRLEAHLGL